MTYSSVSKVTMGWTNGFQFLARVGNFLFSQSPDCLFSPFNVLSSEYWGLFPREKEAGAWDWPLTST